MVTQEERLKILQMVADGTLTPEDAARLLEALEETAAEGEAPAAQAARRRSARWFRVRVTDTNTGRTRVNITLPLMLVRAGLRIGGRLNIGGIAEEKLGPDVIQALEEALTTGEGGKLVDIVDEEDGEHVEIFVE